MSWIAISTSVSKRSRCSSAPGSASRRCCPRTHKPSPRRRVWSAMAPSYAHSADGSQRATASLTRLRSTRPTKPSRDNTRQQSIPIATHRRPGNLVFASKVFGRYKGRKLRDLTCREEGATSPNACFSTPAYYDPNILVALTRSWPFVIIPVIRPRDVVAKDGGDRGGTLTADRSDLPRRPHAAPPPVPTACHLAPQPPPPRRHLAPTPAPSNRPP